AHRVGEARARHGLALGLEPGRPVVVGRQEHVEGRAVLDLRVELPGRAERSDRPVAGGLLELPGDRLHGGGEIGGHGDLDFGGRGGCRQGDSGQGQDKTQAMMTHEGSGAGKIRFRYVVNYITKWACRPALVLPEINGRWETTGKRTAGPGLPRHGKPQYHF